MRICTVPVHDFFAPKLECSLLPKLGGMSCVPDKTAKENACTLLQTLRLHALTSPDRIWGLPRWRIMCMPTKLFVSVAWAGYTFCYHVGRRGLV